MPHPEDDRIAYVLRAIRRRLGLRQIDVAARANVPREDVIALEAGRAGEVRVERVRRVFDALGGHARLTVWWRGAAADRLLDERHAAMVERVLEVARQRGWETAVEVTFSRFGERGSIDVLAGQRSCAAAAVIEVKGSIGALEEVNRSLDAKVRLAPAIVRDTFGWSPKHVGRILVVPDESSVRRLVARHAATMEAAYPARSREVRAWLRAPQRSLRGLWFLSEVAKGDSAP